jgi:UPF0716 family protein affecting phage T7 exclusion
MRRLPRVELTTPYLVVVVGMRLIVPQVLKEAPAYLLCLPMTGDKVVKVVCRTLIPLKHLREWIL